MPFITTRIKNASHQGKECIAFNIVVFIHVECVIAKQGIDCKMG